MRSGLKVLQDYSLATKEAIFVLQQWLTWLERVQVAGPVEAGEFEMLCQQVREAGLGNWLELAGGHDLAVLSQAIHEQAHIEPVELVE